eukprot:1896-Heterococcus_DN1.PRE.1
MGWRHDCGCRTKHTRGAPCACCPFAVHLKALIAYCSVRLAALVVCWLIISRCTSPRFIEACAQTSGKSSLHCTADHLRTCNLHLPDQCAIRVGFALVFYDLMEQPFVSFNSYDDIKPVNRTRSGKERLTVSSAWI